MLVIAAFRYFLGRMTIPTCCFAGNLAKVWTHLPRNVQSLIYKELEEAFQEDDRMRSDPVVSPHYYPLGASCDREAWQKVRNHWHPLTNQPNG